MSIMKNNEIILKSKITSDLFTEYAKQMYDLPPEEEETLVIKGINIDQIPKEWNIGLVIGPSGSGKSTIAKYQFGDYFDSATIDFERGKSLISNFDGVCDPETAGKYLSLCGLSSVPAWLRPYNVLSTGQKARADLSYCLAQHDKVFVDEFTSTVNREVAKSLSYSVQKIVKKENKQMVLCSCHYDIVDWLAPDWIYDVQEQKLTVNRRALRQISRPDIEVVIEECEYEKWNIFKDNHYLTQSLNKAARCFVMKWNDVPVGFCGVLSQPHEMMINYYRESRLVVSPDFQGLGLGTKLSEYIGAMLKTLGHNYISITTHPSFVWYRNNSDKWLKQAEGKNETQHVTEKTKIIVPEHMLQRYTFTHKYVGPALKVEDSEFNPFKVSYSQNVTFDDMFLNKIETKEKTCTIRNYRLRKGTVISARSKENEDEIKSSLSVIAIDKIADVKDIKKAHGEASGLKTRENLIKYLEKVYPEEMKNLSSEKPLWCHHFEKYDHIIEETTVLNEKRASLSDLFG